MIQRITESTLLPISLVFTLIAGMFSLGILYANVNTHDKAIAKIDKKQENLENKQELSDKEIHRDLQDIIQKLARIEGEFKQLNQ